MVAFLVKDFGGEIPRRDTRLLPDNMAEISTNCDLSGGTLAGLPQLETIINLGTAGAPYPVRKAYRLPGPTASDPDVWMALPSEFSSVVRSPLANDTLHAVYWSNPPGTPQPGAWWNTYARLKVDSPNYNLGFTPPPANIGPLTVTIGKNSGTYPGYEIYGADVVDRGQDYVPGEKMTPIGGGANPDQPEFEVTIAATTAMNIALLTGGVGGTPPGGYTLTGATGAGTLLQVFGNVSAGGVLTNISGIVNPGAYTTNPTNPGYDSLVGANLSGADVSFTLGVWSLTSPVFSNYWQLPPDPTPTSASGTGSGCTLHLLYSWNNAPPLIERSYCYTLIDEYGYESSPSLPSAVVTGPSDANWIIANLPTTVTPSPSGKTYPQVLKMRLYRTLTSETGQADFYMVDDLIFGPSTYVDDIPDTTIVNNNTLPSTSWASAVDNLDGLTALPGGMLVGFTGNTVHFCEPDRPHAWPAGYDQSLLYPIVGLAVWQQSLTVLTKGYPSSGAGNNPANYIFSQVQAPEPCIARGSIVTDLAGVYYASQNGLIMLNYYGMQNQTLSNLTNKIWLTEYHAASIVACRHRAQYLAVNGTGTGFLIDYTEERMGITHVSVLSNIVSVWNDTYTGDAYMCDTGGVVYRWDSTTTAPLNYQWRSKQFYLPAPSSLGACQISLDMPGFVVSEQAGISLPPGINAVFNLFVGPKGENLVLAKNLTQPREIFRLPSGRKAFTWQFEIIANCPVHSVELASTMRELKQV